jgi:hypothetical protein
MNLIDRERRVGKFLGEPFGGTEAWFDDGMTGKMGWKSMLEQGGMPGDRFWDLYMLTSTFRNGDVTV